MLQRKIDLVLNNRIYPKKAIAAAIDAFKDFMEVTPKRSSSGHIKYEVKVLPGVCAEEAIAEFFNFTLGCAKTGYENK